MLPVTAENGPTISYPRGKRFVLITIKDQLAAADSSGAKELQIEIEHLEARIDELTSFKSGTTFK